MKKVYLFSRVFSRLSSAVFNPSFHVNKLALSVYAENMMLMRRRKRRSFLTWVLVSMFVLTAMASESADEEQEVQQMHSPIDCDFDLKLNTNGMCSWRPEETRDESASIWHTGNSVLVDSANSIVKSPMGGRLLTLKTPSCLFSDDRFAFVQGKLLMSTYVYLPRFRFPNKLFDQPR